MERAAPRLGFGSSAARPVVVDLASTVAAPTVPEAAVRLLESADGTDGSGGARLLLHEALEATRGERTAARWAAQQRAWGALRERLAAAGGRSVGELALTDAEEWRQHREVRSSEGSGRAGRTV